MRQCEPHRQVPRIPPARTSGSRHLRCVRSSSIVSAAGAAMSLRPHPSSAPSTGPVYVTVTFMSRLPLLWALRPRQQHPRSRASGSKRCHPPLDGRTRARDRPRRRQQRSRRRTRHLGVHARSTQPAALRHVQARVRPPVCGLRTLVADESVGSTSVDGRDLRRSRIAPHTMRTAP